MEMTKEQKQALAVANARLRLQQQGQQEPNVPTSGFLMGLKDPLSGGAQLLEKALPQSVVNQINKLNQTLAEYGLVSKLPEGGVGEMIRQEEQAYQEQREARGESGIEWSRVAGNIINPANIVPGTLAAKGAALVGGGRFAQAAAAGGAGALLQPLEQDTTGEKGFARGKAEQVATGAATGLVFQGAINVGAKVGNFLKEIAKPMRKEGRDALLRDALKEFSGPDQKKIIDALQNAEEIVPGSKPTAAQALANVPEATQLAALEQRLAKSEGLSPMFARRQAEQQAARQAELGRVSGTPEELTALRAERTAVTAPIREDALAQANIAGELGERFQKEIAQKEASRINALQQQGQFQTMAAEQGVLAQQPFYPVPGMPRVASRYSPSVDRVSEAIDAAKDAGEIVAQRTAERALKQFELDSLEQNGFFPLKINDLVAKIDTIKVEPGLRSSDVVQKTFRSLKEKLSNPEYVSPSGIIDSRDLYTIRKEIGNDIATFAKESSNWDSKLTAGLEKNIKSYIDNSIVKSGGVDWKNYLSKYSEYSKQINQKEIGQFLQEKLRTSLDVERAGAFTQAVQDASSVVKRASGVARYGDVKEVLTESQLASINKVAADLLRADKAAQLGRKTSLGSLNIDDSPELPQLLNRTATVANALLKGLRNKANTEINKRAAELFADPQALATFMSAIPKSKTKQVVDALYSRLSPQNREVLNRALAVEGVVAATQQPEGSLRIEMETGPGATR